MFLQIRVKEKMFIHCHYMKKQINMRDPKLLQYKTTGLKEWKCYLQSLKKKSNNLIPDYQSFNRNQSWSRFQEQLLMDTEYNKWVN